MAQDLTTGTRMMSVITSRGEAKKLAVAPGITTWKQLQVILTQAGYVLSNMKVVESIGKATLEHPEAVIPSISFRLYIMPMESKSGAAKAAKAAKKEVVAKKATTKSTKEATSKKAAKKAAPAAKPARSSRAKTNQAETEVVNEDSGVAGLEEVEVEEYEPTPEELQMEYQNISQGIPGVKKR